MPSARSRSPRRSDPLRAQLDLSPSTFDRVVELTRGTRFRTATVRKIAAVVLATLGVVLFFRGDPATDTVAVVVSSRDLTPGQVIADSDVEMREIDSKQLPEGVVSDTDLVVGRTVAGPIRSGETVTDVRVLSPRLAGLSVGTDDARIVPVRLADAAVADMLRSGDVVDVLTVGPDTSRPDTPHPDTPNESVADKAPQILAAGAVVALVTTSESTRNQQEQVILLALPTPAANVVAAASLSNAITVTFR
ncbi:Flp pilus assembly protein CpaB [Rhodococcus sp. OAS809]|jgi:Flp pilus assembly protein CpaB|uniref:SAF domain-containing protein n=1 Tax=Rhodococcus TaxID=1827 RepID=UPI0006418E13|nr:MULTISPECIES: SAF domain-containing protein [Rhodococcus]KLN67578.1 flagellar basal body P-ring biosynthesis protein FlgA [Rhodococcus erythropolis]ANQ69790.1 flagellar biosynthesis protein FlgA [Rhodococcus sp. 008]KSU82194.1 flagellar biosynthesis protein FlgA [Rhodococcus qingshengii]MBP1048722.1 flagella basal body P-ring formation protein FlgA [Rhodococcus qingshengii]MBS3691078.1 flagella basal body P-ring formation protein FlgA [Rhodococcus qingshengii]